MLQTSGAHAVGRAPAGLVGRRAGSFAAVYRARYRGAGVAGMRVALKQPHSRRAMWDAIAAAAPGRSIVLTTHSMEECEALCARLGVMVEGTLRCLGPIQTLKSTYGQGYKLDLRLDLERSQPDESHLTRRAVHGVARRPH